MVGTGLMLLGTGLYIQMDAATPLVHLIVFQVIAGFGIGKSLQPAGHSHPERDTARACRNSNLNPGFYPHNGHSYRRRHRRHHL